MTKSAETHQTLSMAMKKRQGREAITTATMVAVLHFIQQSNVTALCTALTPDSRAKVGVFGVAGACRQVLVRGPSVVLAWCPTEISKS